MAKQNIEDVLQALHIQVRQIINAKQAIQAAVQSSDMSPDDLNRFARNQKVSNFVTGVQVLQVIVAF